MNAILAWLKSKNASSHSIAAGAVVIAGIIMTDEKVRDFVLALFAKHPDVGTAIVTIAGIIFKYSSSRTPAAIVGAAQQIQVAPNPPSQTEVDATKGTK
jgi:hypothetical protein